MFQVIAILVVLATLGVDCSSGLVFDLLIAAVSS